MLQNPLTDYGLKSLLKAYSANHGLKSVVNRTAVNRALAQNVLQNSLFHSKISPHSFLPCYYYFVLIKQLKLF